MFTALRNAYVRLAAVLDRLAERFEEFEASMDRKPLEAQLSPPKAETPAVSNGRKVTSNGKRG